MKISNIAIKSDIIYYTLFKIFKLLLSLYRRHLYISIYAYLLNHFRIQNADPECDIANEKFFYLKYKG